MDSKESPEINNKSKCSSNQDKFHQMKNMDIDNLMIQERNNEIVTERIRSKTVNSVFSNYKNNSNKMFIKMRQPEIFDSIIITKLKHEKIQDYIESLGIHPSLFLKMPYLTGKVIYYFKIIIIDSDKLWE